MADLQDDPHAATVAVGDLGDPAAHDPAPPMPRPSTKGSAEAADSAGHAPGSLERARELLAAHPIADGYSGLARVLRDTPSCDLEQGDRLLETDIPRLRDGGVGAQFWALHMPPECTGDGALSATLEQIDLVRAQVAAWPEGLRLALSANDMADARNCGRVATLLGPVAGAALCDSLGTLRAYHALGVRSLTLAGTRWTDGTGLTRFGHEVVREMNRLGVLVDLSGCSPETMRRTLTVARAPVVISHHPGQVPDDVLSLLRANHGVCMVVCTAETIRETADRLDHVREVAGPESVALSGAYDTGTPHAPSLKDVSCFPRLIAELLNRDWPDADIESLTWLNVSRVLRDAEFQARATRPRRAPSTATLTALDA
ncbi:membrane dipeptidase [Streptomyces lunaelactis]|uniref:dipeptidase n=1 Tax=Streptomyces lunaelactis TaxID=1535768 RepID=UPI001584AF66|nr:dipeptidase [Streptomyces lunaelactis]NUK12038.1 membrane dipeptidase [Streptomyces lunaelactis]NUK62004.1 membrane dipeptidase [Streptomyces lunaelactis]NUL14050.1 membrane dipeptidase [Streptomyces lunaelactis]NUL27492.1 membrane dipeptidase [Streptomyces lunaelactis]